MGNILIEDKGKVNPMKAFEAYIDDYPQLIPRGTLFDNKLFKTQSYKADATSLIIKVYIHRKQLTNLEVSIHENNFLYMKQMLASIQFSNLMPYQKLINFNDKQQYQTMPQKQVPSQEEQLICNKEFLAVCRQQLHTTLNDKLQISGSKTTKTKQNFMALQILLQIHTLHQLKLYHGNVRTSNILLTSNDHAVLTDFATYKPYYQIEDQFGEFKNMYQTSFQNCTLAPEKFLPSTEFSPNIIDLFLLPQPLLTSLQQMDMFSIGVVIAQIYFPDEYLFTYEQLMLYRKGEYDPSPIIRKIGIPQIENLVINLIQKDPLKRFHAQEALQYFFDEIIPKEKKQVYVWYHYLDCAVTQSYQFSQPDLRIQLVRKIFLQLLTDVCGDKNLPLQIIENGIQFQFAQPLPIQKIPVNAYFTEILSDSQPKIFEIVQGVNKIVLHPQKVNKFTTSNFMSGTANEFSLGSEPYENAGNLKIKQYQQSHELFASLDRASQDIMRMSQVEKLRASVTLLQHRQSSNSQDLCKSEKNEDSSGLLQESKVDSFIAQPTLLRDLKLQHHFQKSEEAQYLVQILCQQLQNLRFAQSKLCTLEMLEFLSMYLDDIDNYYLTLPYIGALFQDTDTQVVQQAFSVFITILRQLKSPFKTVEEVKLFGLYYWPSLLKIIQNEDPIIQRIAFEKIEDLVLLVSQYDRFTQKYKEQYPEITQNIRSDFQKDFIETLTFKLEQTNYSRNTDFQQLILQNLAIIFRTFKDCFQLVMLISCFNKPELRLFVIRNLLPVFEVQSLDNQKLLLACLDQQLLSQNDLLMYYTLNFFMTVVKLSLISREIEQYYLKMISPIMLYPNLQVRNEAIGYVTVLIEKYNQEEIYTYIQPIVVNYLKDQVAFINADILRVLVGDMINKQKVDFKSLNINEQLNMSTRERLITTNFIQNFLKKVQSKFKLQVKSSQHSNEKEEKEEKLIYQKKLEALDKRHDLEISLGKKINDFIIATFKANLFFIGDQDDVNCDKNSATLIKESIPEKYDWKLETVTSKKLKQLQSLVAQLQSNLSYIIDKKKNVLPQSVQSQVTFRNIFNAILIFHQIEVKARQLGVKGDITVQRVTSGIPPLRPFKPQQQLITTISEHKDIVSTVQNFRDQRFFISGSHDGTVKIFDMNRIDKDFTAGSVTTVKCGGDAEKQNHKVLALKSLEFSDSFLVGTNTGLIELHKLDHLNAKKGLNAGVSQLRTFKKANADIKKIESMNPEFSEAVFVYVTSLGDIVVEDIRSRSQAMTFSVGKERGLVTSMIQRGNSLSTCISTLNGYCLVYDLRCNIISNVFQLLDPDNKALPIYTMANFKRVSNLDGVDALDLIAIGFQSNYNEVGFWNFNDLNENLNPSIFLNCSDKRDIIIQNPRLRSYYKNEQFKNFSNTLEDRCFYNFVGSHHQMDLINYLIDPLTSSQSAIKERWLDETKNCYSSMKAAFDAKSSVTSIIALPYSGALGSSLPGKPVENTIITASTDRCVQSWTLASDGGKPGERPFEKELEGTIICQPSNYYEFQRRFKQAKSGDVYVIHDYEVKNTTLQNVLGKEPQIQQHSSLRKEYRIDHKDCITDMTFLEREQGLLITSSRDQTIKIWK